MQSLSIIALYLAATLTLCAALLHFICILWGANGYRFLGAGKSMVDMVESGKLYPHLITIAVGLMLLLCSTYAYFAARGITLLPFSKPILSIFAAILLIRGFAFPILKSKFVGNSDLFWYISSAFCLLLGGLYAVGISLS